MGVGVDHGLRLEKKGRGVITAVYDPDHNKVAPATARAELGNKIMVHNSFEAMALDDNVDVLIIGSPNYIHAGQVEFCAPLRKPVFLEKPIGANLAEADRIVKAVNFNNCLCQVGLVYRYSPFFTKCMEFLHTGLIGDIQMMWCHEFVDWIWQPEWRCNQSLSGGALVEKNCHHFDIFNWALKDAVSPQMVNAFGGRNYYHDREIIDNAFVNIEYINGVRASLALCMFSKYCGLKFGFIGTKGTLETQMDGSERPRRDLITFYPRNHERSDKMEIYVDYESEFRDCVISPQSIHGSNLGHSGNVNEVVSFADCVEQGKKPFCNVEIGRNSLLIPIAAEQSITESRTINIADIA